MPSLAENVVSVKARIEQALKDANSPANFPRIIAVSKSRTAEQVRCAYAEGLLEFGENYLQEAVEKITTTADLGICWHFIGPIQSNKTSVIAKHFQWVQSIDRLKIAQRLSEQRPKDMQPLQICIQVNLDAEQTKSGILPDELYEFAHQVKILPQLNLRGIMCIPKPKAELEEKVETCRRAHKLFAGLQQEHRDIDTLSLGMSADLEAAIIAGTTMVRIGTDIFGPRSK